MTTQQVANRLVELCRMGQIETAQKELFANHVVSTEPDGAPMKEVKGLPAVLEKGQQFMAMVQEFHGSTISDPVVTGDHFAIAWDFDATMKGHERSVMKEICVYKVKDGKIDAEQFFF